jgi:C4-type Zn-finger protein
MHRHFVYVSEKKTAVNAEITKNVFLQHWPLPISFQGITRLLLTKIPHYKEIILMSFNCDHCGLQNNEIQSGGKIQVGQLQIDLKYLSSAKIEFW